MASALAAAAATVALTGRSGERASSVAADLPGRDCHRMLPLDAVPEGLRQG